MPQGPATSSATDPQTPNPSDGPAINMATDSQTPNPPAVGTDDEIVMAASSTHISQTPPSEMSSKAPSENSTTEQNIKLSVRFIAGSAGGGGGAVTLVLLVIAILAVTAAIRCRKKEFIRTFPNTCYSLPYASGLAGKNVDFVMTEREYVTIDDTNKMSALYVNIERSNDYDYVRTTNL